MSKYKYTKTQIKKQDLTMPTVSEALAVGRALAARYPLLAIRNRLPPEGRRLPETMLPILTRIGIPPLDDPVTFEQRTQDIEEELGTATALLVGLGTTSGINHPDHLLKPLSQFEAARAEIRRRTEEAPTFLQLTGLLNKKIVWGEGYNILTALENLHTALQTDSAVAAINCILGPALFALTCLSFGFGAAEIGNQHVPSRNTYAFEDKCVVIFEETMYHKSLLLILDDPRLPPWQQSIHGALAFIPSMMLFTAYEESLAALQPEREESQRTQLQTRAKTLMDCAAALAPLPPFYAEQIPATLNTKPKKRPQCLTPATLQT
jgi:hypothetical protein